MLKRISRGLWNYRRIIILILTPLLLLPLPLVVKTKEAECAFVLLLMAVFWMTEVIPLSMTAMLPAILFPAFGIMKSSHVAREYFKDFHFLLVGVICLATSVEKCGLHRRMALKLVSMVGVNPAWLMLGFMSGCALISMWIQNVSAAAMVMPIVEAVLQQILKAEELGCAGNVNPNLQMDEKKKSVVLVLLPLLPVMVYFPPFVPLKVAVCVSANVRKSERDRMMYKAMSMGVAYAANIGGISTLPGTSPNLIFSEYLNQVYPECNCINFGNWLLMCFPIMSKNAFIKSLSQEILRFLYSSGQQSPQEIFTGIIFVVMVLLWLTRSPGFMPGWASLFPDHTGYITEATVALVLGLLFFIFFSVNAEAMITWEEFRSSMPWMVVLLVGGGFALAEGTKVSGLSVWVAQLMTPLGDLPVLATITVACIIVTTLTEVASNAATTTIFLPILSPLAEAIHVNPLYVLIPTTLCISFSFLLPVSNPPNALVFSYGHITIMDMVKAGIGVNVIGVLTVMMGIATWGIPLFSLDTYPDWAPVHPG
uniref:Solute carrier family 13 member 1 n=1 Tax=Cyprinodon variegatus TaxID=28743 RepID=A0A3Q2FNW7_CYPVA